MVRIHLDLVNNEWNVVEKSKFWMHEMLLEKLKNLEKN